MVPGATSGTVSGGGTLNATNAQGMLDGRTYVNVHSTTFAGGEIRGRVVRACPGNPDCPGDLTGPNGNPDGSTDSLEFFFFSISLPATTRVPISPCQRVWVWRISSHASTYSFRNAPRAPSQGVRSDFARLSLASSPKTLPNCDRARQCSASRQGESWPPAKSRSPSRF
ncbi:MAG: CHRD domain-containing protein [Phycisphaeraceae bacterium]|nr:CHRD domain-containing protein [Phycisphaeraceae bacterium]